MNRVGNYLNITTMCLITNQKEPVILKKDLIVYKVLTKILESPLQAFKYYKNTLYETKIEESERPSFADEESKDFYGGRGLGDLSMQTVLELRGLKSFGKGFHSAATEERAINYKSKFYIGSFPKYAIFSCIIPKGSEIYRDATGLIISNKLIIKERTTL